MVGDGTCIFEVIVLLFAELERTLEVPIVVVELDVFFVVVDDDDDDKGRMYFGESLTFTLSSCFSSHLLSSICGFRQPILENMVIMYVLVEMDFVFGFAERKRNIFLIQGEANRMNDSLQSEEKNNFRYMFSIVLHGYMPVSNKFLDALKKVVSPLNSDQISDFIDSSA